MRYGVLLNENSRRNLNLNFKFLFFKEVLLNLFVQGFEL